MRSCAAVDLRKKLFWVSVLYFAEGFPYGLFKDLFPVYFRFHGVSLRDIGLMSLLALPWTLKVFWSPLVDRFGTLRGWTGSMLLLLAALCVAVPFFDPAAPTPMLWAVLLGITIASATQDIAIDALTIRMLTRGEEGPANGVRVTAYRVAIILGGGALAATAQWLGWRAVFWSCAVVFVATAAIASRAPDVPRQKPTGGSTALLGIGLVLLALFIGARKAGVEIPDPAGLVKKLGLSPGAEVLATAGVVLGLFAGGAFGVNLWLRKTGRFSHSWLARPAAPLLVLFILLYRIGEFAMGPMVRPFWVDRGFLPTELFTVTTTAGVGFTIAGALSGGWFVRRFGLMKSLWILGFAQAASNLGYAAVAGLGLTASGWERAGFWGASIVESYCSGLGTAAFLATLMRVCGKENAATEYALLSAIFGFAGAVAGAFSGWAAEAVGYPVFFTVTFLIALPPMFLLLLPALRDWIREEPEPVPEPAS